MLILRDTHDRHGQSMMHTNHQIQRVRPRVCNQVCIKFIFICLPETKTEDISKTSTFLAFHFALKPKSPIGTSKATPERPLTP